MHSIKVVVVERKQHDLAEKKLQKANSKWNEDKIKQLDYINQRLCQKKKKKKKHITTKLFLPLEPHLKDLNDPSKKKKKYGELLFVTLDTELAAYSLFKYFKQMAGKKLNEVFSQSYRLWIDNKAVKEV